MFRITVTFWFPAEWDVLAANLRDLLAVSLVQSDPLVGKSFQGGGCHGLVVPGDVVPAEVVRHDEQDVRPSSLPLASRQQGHYC